MSLSCADAQERTGPAFNVCSCAFSSAISCAWFWRSRAIVLRSSILPFVWMRLSGKSVNVRHVSRRAPPRPPFAAFSTLLAYLIFARRDGRGCFHVDVAHLAGARPSRLCGWRASRLPFSNRARFLDEFFFGLCARDTLFRRAALFGRGAFQIQGQKFFQGPFVIKNGGEAEVIS